MLKHRPHFMLALILSLSNASFTQPFWQRQADLQPLTPPVSFSAVNDRIAWVCDFNARVWRTTDAGQSWLVLGTVTREEKISCLTALDANTALVGGAGMDGANGSASLYRTTDGGLSWQVVYTAKGPEPYWYALRMFDAANGIAMSDPPSANENFLIAKTEDAGKTWRRVAQTPRPQETEFGLGQASFFFDRTHGWFGTGVNVHQSAGSRTFRTNDGGESWTLLPNPPNIDLQALHFISPLVGVRASALPPFLTRTIDGGQTWQALAPLPIAEVQYLKLLTGIQTTATQQLWLYGEAGQEYRPFILTSNDSGWRWEEQTLADIGASKVLQLAAVAFGAKQDSVQAWGVIYDFSSQRGGIMSYRARRTSTHVTGSQHELPATIFLAQNYPNPFNPSTMMQYELPHAAHVRLAIYNLLGERVRTLVDAKESAGVKRVTWDGRNEHGERVSSGVYVYRLEAGEFRMARRLVLMK